MRVADLSKRAMDLIRRYRYDRILEKHEGPWDWSDVLDGYEPEFLTVGGRAVLLPLGRKHHRKIKMERVIASDDGKVLTLLFTDTTHADEEDEMELKFFSGRVAICEKVSGEDFFIATLYHERYVVKNPES